MMNCLVLELKKNIDIKEYFEGKTEFLVKNNGEFMIYYYYFDELANLKSIFNELYNSIKKKLPKSTSNIGSSLQLGMNSNINMIDIKCEEMTFLSENNIGINIFNYQDSQNFTKEETIKKLKRMKQKLVKRKL